MIIVLQSTDPPRNNTPRQGLYAETRNKVLFVKYCLISNQIEIVLPQTSPVRKMVSSRITEWIRVTRRILLQNDQSNKNKHQQSSSHINNYQRPKKTMQSLLQSIVSPISLTTLEKRKPTPIHPFFHLTPQNKILN